MSLIVAWIAIDTHAIASAYIASESRVSWKNANASIDYYDSCRKTFYIEKYPELIAYCGDVLFPSLLISSVIDTINKGMIFNPTDNSIERYKKFKKYLFNEFHKYPKNRMGDDFELLYINKDINAATYPKYYAYKVSWNKKKGFSSKSLKLPEKSGVLHVMGSGSKEFNEMYLKFQKKRSKGTSRNIYQCFAKLLCEISDNQCGGPPQLVGLYRKPNTNGFSFGILHNRKRYYNGLCVGNTYNDDKIEWRNKYFEVCSGKYKKRKADAQNQEADIS